MTFRYTVSATFEHDEVAREWLEWLACRHCAEVRDGGARTAEVVAIDGDAITFEVRYDFPSRDMFETYEQEHAPGLRAEGLDRFPTERGITYARTSGEIVHSEG